MRCGRESGFGDGGVGGGGGGLGPSDSLTGDVAACVLTVTMDDVTKTRRFWFSILSFFSKI